MCPYAAKGLWRQEFTNARHMMDEYVREQLMKMLDWYVGIKTDFKVSMGKGGKYLEKYLEPELWHLLLETYAGNSYEQSWQALFKMAELFRIIAIQVAEYFGYEYPYGDDQRVSAHLRYVKDLPRQAEEMYPDAAAVGEL
jgi:aminoglycoside 6-adenylyltransferase